MSNTSKQIRTNDPMGYTSLNDWYCILTSNKLQNIHF